MIMSAAAVFVLFGIVAPQQQNTAPPITPAPTVTQAPPITPAPSAQTNLSSTLTTAPVVAEPSRLMMTPELSGVVENDEWDPLISGPSGKTYLQWTPGNIYVAGVAPQGSDLLLSLDIANDGWLVGSDNYEARVHLDANNNPVVSIRRLNAANVAGPSWEDLPGWTLASICKASFSGSNVEYELKLSDAGVGALPTKPQLIGARVDLISSGEPPIPTTQARVLTPINLVMTRSEGLPSNLTFGLEHVDRPVIPGESSSIVWNFTSKPKTPTSPVPSIKKINVFAEGNARAKMSEMTSPFPAFDKSGHSSIDYVTKVALDALPGWHVLQATLTLGDDTPASVEASFKIAEPIEVSLSKPQIPVTNLDRSVTVEYDIQSNIAVPVQGSVSFTVDPSLHVLNQATNISKFTLEPKGRSSSRFTLFVPANTAGTYPITFEVTSTPRGATGSAPASSTGPGVPATTTTTRKVTRYLTISPNQPNQKKKHHGLFGIG